MNDFRATNFGGTKLPSIGKESRMRSGLFLSLVCLVLIVPGIVSGQTINLELMMPSTMFGPGSPFSLDLNMENTGSDRTNVQLFVALSIGSDFWFYPNWVHYPPNIDWDTIDVPAGSAMPRSILPEFPWPDGAGAFDGAMFFGALIDNGNLISNLADVTFGWTQTAQPTSTPALPTSTPTSSLPTSTPTPSGPTPTSPPVPTGFVYVAPGTFTMGSPEGEICREADETQHEVTLTKGFFMQQTEVTRQMWADLKAVQASLPDDPSAVDSSPTMDHPVQFVTWNESLLYANLLSLQNGYTRCYYTDATFETPVDDTNYMDGPFFCNFNASGYRLPTESEWEYACRAGTTTAFSCVEGNYSAENCAECNEGALPTLEQYCAYCANTSDTTNVVGSKLPNPWDLYDMHGNVWEWCWDWYASYPEESVTDPTGPADGDDHMRRGGAWRLVAQTCRSASRFIISPDYRFTFQGFRIVRPVE